MSDQPRDWDRELAKIDKQLEGMSDQQLFPSTAAKTPQAKAQVGEVQRRTNTFGVFARLTLAVALGIGMLFWPYEARCGFGLVGYLGAVLVVAGAGIWSAVWTWRHQAARAHVLSLLIFLWGLVLGALVVLPRVGYAKEAARWLCQ